jgi:flavin reductase (DIM6/NTAB) family NADH-FMN oxidoreductase RutF
MSSAPFRQLMRLVPASVSVIATGAPGQRNGLTATSICSLSVAPPTLIACVSHRASAHDEIIRNGYFSINVLSDGDHQVATMFSADSGARGEARFIAEGWNEGFTGAPVLKTALCYLECRLADSARGSTHTIFFGDVVAGSALAGANPLIYMDGDFRTLSSRVLRDSSSDRAAHAGLSSAIDGDRRPHANLSASRAD